MKKVKIETDFIKLDQFLKWAGVVGQGSDAKEIINLGLVKVNGQPETRRGKKLRSGDRVIFENNEIEIE